MSKKSRREVEKYADVLHGKQLMLIIQALRANLHAQQQELARTMNEGRRLALAVQIKQTESLLAMRESELKAAVRSAADERQQTQNGEFSTTR